jgi:hypothetical protein
MSTDATDNEFTPRELGLLAGHAWGSASATTSGEVAEVAETGIVPEDVLDITFQTGVAARMAEFPDAAEAESEFWQGFVHGFELSSSRTWRGSPRRPDWGTADFGAPIRR